MGVRALRRWPAVVTGFALAAGLLAPPLVQGAPALAATGDVDPTFGTNGTAFTNLHTGTQTDLMVRGSATTSDGHLLVVGDTRTDLRDSTRAIVVLRFDGNGQLDPTFGTAGTTVVGNAGRRDEAVDVAVTPDGRILVAGHSIRPESFNPDQLVVVRLTPTGAPDPTFATDGVARVDLDPAGDIGHRSFAVVATPSGGARVATYTPLGSGIVALDAAGALDTTFSGDGVLVTAALGSADPAVRDLAQQHDGTLVALTQAGAHPSVMRVDAAGTILSQTALGLAPCVNWFDPWVCAVTVDDLDRIVVTSGTDGGVTRVDATGGVDATFATNGIFTPPLSAVQRLFLGITTSASGAIYAGGVDYAETAPGEFRYLHTTLGLDGSGAPLAGFGTDGLASVVTGADSVYAMDIETLDGDPVTVGFSMTNLGERSVSMSRIDGAGGVAEPTFGTAGVVSLPMPRTYTLEDAIAETVQDAAGRIVGVGSTDTGVLTPVSSSSGQRTLVARWTTDGALDPTFGVGGIVELDTGADGQRASQVAIDSTGRILIGGFGPDGFVVVRLHPNGGLDASFDADGTSSAPDSLLYEMDDLAVDGLGRVLVSGRSTFGGASSPQPIVVRFAADGSLDAGFGTNGIAVVSFGFVNVADRVVVHGGPGGAITLASTGRILGPSGAPEVTGLVRLRDDGLVDATFGDAGLLRTSSLGPLGAIVADPTGTVTVVGAAFGRISVARVGPDGRPDATFGANGRAFVVPTGGRVLVAKGTATDAFGNLLVVAASSEVYDSNRRRPAVADSTVLARFGAFGPDSSFGTNGILERTVTAADRPAGVAVAPDGRILVAGTFEPVAGQGMDIGLVALEGQTPTTGDNVAPTLTVDVPAGLVVGRSAPSPVIGFSCADTGGSGLASCTGPDLGSQQIGQLGLPAGLRPLHFQAVDRAGNITDQVVTIEVIEEATAVFGSIASTLGTNTEATATDPIETSFVLHGTGVNLAEWPEVQSIDGYVLLPWRLQANSSPGSASNPHQLTVWLDSSLVGPAGLDTTNTVVLLAGNPIAACAPGILPCVVSRTVLPSGDLRIDINGTSFGALTFGRLAAVPDLAPPTVSLVTPAANATYTLNQSVLAAYTCADDVAIATCAGPVANGTPVDTATPGTKTFTVTATDTAAQVTTATVTYTVTDDASATFGAGGGTISTGTVASPTDPIESTLTSPTAGTITVAERATATPPPTGYSLLGNEVVITAPTASVANPLRFRFHLDASLLAAGGVTYDTVEIFRNGTAVPPCANPAVVSATPNPCVFARTLLADGDAEIAVYTSAASTWSFGKRAPFAFTGFSGLSAYPRINNVRAGDELELEFSLGGNKGLNVLAFGSPTSTPVNCTTLAPTGGATALKRTLTYKSSKARYELELEIPKAWKNTCRTITLKFTDGATRTVAVRAR